MEEFCKLGQFYNLTTTSESSVFIEFLLSAINYQIANFILSSLISYSYVMMRMSISYQTVI